MPFIEQLAQETAGSLLGIGLSAWNDSRQINQQKNLNVLEREMMDYNMKKQYEMWQKTGYVGQKEQMIKAGLNPALMYGMGGAGGATTGSPGTAHTAAQGHGGEAIGMGIAAANLGLLKAQKENLDANTQETLARIPGHGKEPALKEAQTGNLIADTLIKNLEAEFLNKTMNDRQHLVELARQNAQEQLQIIENDATISEETKNDKIKGIKAEAAGKMIANDLMNANINKTKAEIAKWSAEIANAITQLNINERQLWLNEFKIRTEANNPGLWNTIGGAIQRTINWIDGTSEGNKNVSPPNIKK